MGRSLCITDDPEEIQDSPYMDFVTPEQAVGELVEFEIPGTMGKKVFRISEVNPKDKVTKVVRWWGKRPYDWKTNPPPIWRGKLIFIAHYCENFRFLFSKYRDREFLDDMLQIPVDR